MLSIRKVVSERAGRGSHCMALKRISYILRLRSILLLRMLWVSVMTKFSCLGRVGVYWGKLGCTNCRYQLSVALTRLFCEEVVLERVASYQFDPSEDWALKALSVQIRMY